MANKTIKIADKHWSYLQTQAVASGITLENLVAEMIDNYIDWQKTIQSDSMNTLFGTINSESPIDHAEIDNIVYQANL